MTCEIYNNDRKIKDFFYPFLKEQSQLNFDQKQEYEAEFMRKNPDPFITCDTRFHYRNSGLEQCYLVIKRCPGFSPVVEKIFTFDNFDVDYKGGNPALLSAALKAAKVFMKSKTGKLILMGRNRIGKTHLAKAIQLKEGYHRNNDNREEPFVKLIEAPQFYYMGLKETWPEMVIGDSFRPEWGYKKMLGSEGIIIDDLGNEKTDMKDNFIIFFTSFLDRFTGKLIITTNLNKYEMIDRYGQRIQSRLFEDCIPVPMGDN